MDWRPDRLTPVDVAYERIEVTPEAWRLDYNNLLPKYSLGGGTKDPVVFTVVAEDDGEVRIIWKRGAGKEPGSG